jgi:hypothetical protein
MRHWCASLRQVSTAHCNTACVSMPDFASLCKLLNSKGEGCAGAYIEQNKGMLPPFTHHPLSRHKVIAFRGACMLQAIPLAAFASHTLPNPHPLSPGAVRTLCLLPLQSKSCDLTVVHP